MRLIFVAWLLVAAAQVAAAPLQVEQVAPGVYVHIGQHKDFEEGYDGDIANTGFVVGSEAVAVIDSGGSYAVGLALKEALRRITRLPVRYVINTHGHPDHVFGNAAFLEGDAPPRVIGHAMLPQMLAARGDIYLRNLKKQLGAVADKSRVIAPSETVQQRLTLDLGGRTLELTAWPNAHTNNDLTVFDAASGTLWTGDLLFIARTPSVDGDVTGWLAAMEGLEKIKAGVTVPGHGPATRDKNGALARQRGYLTTLLHDVRSSIREGRDMSATMATAAASERTRWQLFDVVNRRNVNLLYPALEWE
ncbi:MULTISPECIES: quinoprotein relay system zinc metallohydrolase 2 [unclassified Massilia]|uniref:quinoprotein relay system zinc metallohydrolase 2 n=1 Tax=unclassified Massilia TaxID=2609279 RepID=UPI0017858968|nr:quinoprotein relay system zinc metallohydrolase 2 [Massilia sp. CFBP 13647]MBD8672225.1 quinoprotein relay system zinc metallohydrolase 2 [Massilia sp. CFBP 13721]